MDEKYFFEKKIKIAGLISKSLIIKSCQLFKKINSAAQIEERARADQLRDYSDHLYQQKQIELDQQGLELQRQEMECRRY